MPAHERGWPMSGDYSPKETEVTAEMIAAGEAVLAAFSGEVTKATLAGLVWEAMAQASLAHNLPETPIESKDDVPTR